MYQFFVCIKCVSDDMAVVTDDGSRKEAQDCSETDGEGFLSGITSVMRSEPELKSST